MAMQGRLGNGMRIYLFVAALAFLGVSLAEAKNHDVGGASGWDYPAANDAGFYDTWASQQTFLPGDTLTFKYAPAQHDTTVVTAAEYASCAMTTTAKKYTSGSDTVGLPKAGTYYFYCSIMGHCEMGMKMKVTVGVAAAAPVVLPPAPAPPLTNPTPKTSPTPAPAMKAPTPTPLEAPTPLPLKAPTPSPIEATTPSPLDAPTPSPGVLGPVLAPDVLVPAIAPAAAPTPESSSANAAIGVSFKVLAASAGVTLFGSLVMF